MLQRILSLITSIILFFSAGALPGGPGRKQACAVAENKYAAAGYEITMRLLTERYDAVF